MSRVLTVVGARPQFVKASAVSRALADRGCSEALVHTGQHYDLNMSEVFFRELEIPLPRNNLQVGSGGHASQTADMLSKLEPLLRELEPELVVVYGDTNSTLAGALAAVKLEIPVAHVEAGARNGTFRMPEEVNRVVTDRLAALNFCATQSHVGNLAREGIHAGVHFTGDVMYDTFLRYRELALARSDILRVLDLAEGEFVLATLHRPSNVDDPPRLQEILRGLSRAGMPVVFPVHPRTRATLDALPAGWKNPAVELVEPVGYLDMIRLELGCRGVLTDSGGVQKEAYFAGKPCLTVFDSTPWPETVEAGGNELIDADADRIAERLKGVARGERVGVSDRGLFGDGTAAHRIAREICASLDRGLTVDTYRDGAALTREPDGGLGPAASKNDNSQSPKVS